MILLTSSRAGSGAAGNGSSRIVDQVDQFIYCGPPGQQSCVGRVSSRCGEAILGCADGDAVRPTPAAEWSDAFCRRIVIEARAFNLTTRKWTALMGSIEDKNKAIVREAFDTLFNKRDYAAAEKFWAPDYIQHSAHIAPGREGLFTLIKSAPAELRHEVDLIMAEGDTVIVRGRFTGNGRPAAWIAADFVRMQDGLLAEHWDILEDEVSRAESVSGLPMYGDSFPEER